MNPVWQANFGQHSMQRSTFAHPQSTVDANERQITARDPDTVERNLTEAIIVPSASVGGLLSCEITAKMASATTGTVEWEIGVEAISDGDHDVRSADFFDTAIVMGRTVPGTAGHSFTTQTVINNNDSFAPGDMLRVLVQRDADDGTNDTAGLDLDELSLSIYELPYKDSGDVNATTTTTNRPMLRRVWKHDGSWWTIQMYTTASEWRIWKYDGTTWNVQSTPVISTFANAVPDVEQDVADANIFHVLIQADTAPCNYTRLTYSGGTYSVDSTDTIAGIEQTGSKQAVIRQAFDGRVFAFSQAAAAGDGLRVNWSDDNGDTWQGSATTIRDSGDSNYIASTKGQCDAIRFTYSSTNYMGVMWSGELSAAYNMQGFLRLADGAAPGTKANWTFEDIGDTPGPDTNVDVAPLAVLVENAGHLYSLYRVDNSSGTYPYLHIWHRNTSATWESKTVVSYNDSPETSPTGLLSFDSGRSELVVHFDCNQALNARKYGIWETRANISDLVFSTPRRIFAKSYNNYQHIQGSWEMLLFSDNTANRWRTLEYIG